MSETNKELVRKFVDEAQSRGNFGVIDEMVADDFIDHSPFPGVPPTREGLHILFGYLRGAFPDLRVTIHEQVAEAEKVVTRKTFEGTHGGEFMGIPSSGRPVSFEVIDILTVRDGRLAEHRVVFDSGAIRQQLSA
ncbi:MAG TPA: ester cyclase [Thermoanaerobaculia bacterium]|nr:ester cyclase [Thermoanaerobaculia bacterium]